MERFIRDAGLFICMVFWPPGLYLLKLGMDTKDYDASFLLIVGAAVSAASFLSGCCAVKEYLVTRRYRLELRDVARNDRAELPTQRRPAKTTDEMDLGLSTPTICTDAAVDDHAADP
jgi:hypothetical protein